MQTNGISWDGHFGRHLALCWLKGLLLCCITLQNPSEEMGKWWEPFLGLCEEQSDSRCGGWQWVCSSLGVFKFYYRLPHKPARLKSLLCVYEWWPVRSKLVTVGERRGLNDSLSLHQLVWVGAKGQCRACRGWKHRNWNWWSGQFSALVLMEKQFYKKCVSVQRA